MFEQLVTGFTLGNAAILTNVCLLPLYPGLIAFLAGNAQNEESKRATGWLGLLVLAGILTMMILIGFLLVALSATFTDVLPVLLPVIYVVVIALGLLMLSGRNPFNRMTTMQAPVLKNPYVTAYVYGLMFGPMTLPCTGPILTSAFILGAGSFAGTAESLLFVLAFGVGFGWPLLLLPLLALPVQRRFTGWLNQNHVLLTRVSGALLLVIGVFGMITEVLPNSNVV